MIKMKKQNEYIKEKIKPGREIIRHFNRMKVDIWKKIYAWMTYIVPHFRYGALLYRDEKKARTGRTEIIQKYEKTVKETLNLP